VCRAHAAQHRGVAAEVDLRLAVVGDVGVGQLDVGELGGDVRAQVPGTCRCRRRPCGAVRRARHARPQSQGPSADPAGGAAGDPIRAAQRRTVGLMYDHDPSEVEVLGWEEFIARQWESVFAGYRSTAGLRKMCRRWSDLIQIGLGCSQDIADLLVRAEIIQRPDRDLEGAADAHAVVSGMADVLADLRADLLEMGELEMGELEMGEVGPGLRVGLLEQHARLLSFIYAYAFGQDTGEAPGT
jgi:hypothetical protein